MSPPDGSRTIAPPQSLTVGRLVHGLYLELGVQVYAPVRLEIALRGWSNTMGPRGAKSRARSLVGDSVDARGTLSAKALDDDKSMRR